MKREVIVRLTHTEAKWIERLVAHRLMEVEAILDDFDESGTRDFVELYKLEMENMATLSIHINNAAHRAATKKRAAPDDDTPPWD